MPVLPLSLLEGGAFGNPGGCSIPECRGCIDRGRNGMGRDMGGGNRLTRRTGGGSGRAILLNATGCGMGGEGDCTYL